MRTDEEADSRASRAPAAEPTVGGETARTSPFPYGRVASLVLLATPVLLLVLAAWQKRQITDDGFINFRVVDQVFAGNGPVFNAGQRVEAYTSPAWLLVLIVGRALFGWTASMGQIAVVAGIGCAVGAVVFAELGARQLVEATAAGREDTRSSDRRVLLPIGALVVVAFPPMWHWATSGLDTALFLCWLGGSFWVLTTAVRRHREPAALDSIRGRWRWSLAAMLIGSGWLVRPDAAIFSIAFLAVLAVLVDGTRTRLKLVAVGLAPSIGYELFRMGYFANLISNSSLAKQPTQSEWAQGWAYLTGMTTEYSLWPVLAALAILFGLQLRPLIGPHASDGGRRRSVIAVAMAPVVPALVHALWVIRVGGDYLHARFFVPAVFAVALPIAVMPLWIRARNHGRLDVANIGAAALSALLVLWCGAQMARHGWLRPDELDQQPSYLYAATTTNATELADYPADHTLGEELRQLGARRENVLVDTFGIGRRTVATDPTWGTVALVPASGVAGESAGVDVWVYDAYGLTDPIGSRLPLRTDRAGHQRTMPASFVEGRFAPPGDLRAQAANFRRATTCGDLAGLLAATDEPMTIGRFTSNVINAPRYTFLTVPKSGPEIEEQFCGTAPP